MSIASALVLLAFLVSGSVACFSYTLVAGDTCYDLSQRFGVTLDGITVTTDENKLCADSRMWVGDVLSICGTAPAPPPPHAGVGGVSTYLSESLFNSMYPNRNASRYSYSNFITASKRSILTGFCNGADEVANKRELAMFLANAGHESVDFIYVCEACSNPNCGQCSATYNYGGDSAHQYYGRGALQLSWNYNYQAAGNALGVDFLTNPSVVGSTGDYVFSSALWFWMYAGCHAAAQGNQGFGNTIRIINGGLECKQSPGSNGYNEMMDRVNRYKKVAAQFGVDPGSDLTC